MEEVEGRRKEKSAFGRRVFNSKRSMFESEHVHEFVSLASEMGMGE